MPSPDAAFADRAGIRLLHLLAAVALAVAQPLYEVLTDNPEFVIAHDLGRGDLVVIALLLSVGVAVGLWLGVELSALFGRRARSTAQCLAVGLLLATMVLALVSPRPAPLALRLALFALSAGLLALAYTRIAVLRRLLSALALGAVVFPALFLWRSLPDRGLDESRSAAVSESVPQRESPARLAVADPPPLVIVVFDELPMASLLVDEATVDGARFPSFAALAARSHWFRRATTVAQSTSAAVPAILTGRYPRGKAPPTAEGHPDNLFALLQGSYHLNVSETLTAICGAACEEGPGAAEGSVSSPRPRRTDRLRWALADLGAVYLALRLPGAGPTVSEGWAGFWSETLDLDPDLEDGDEARQPWLWKLPPQRFARFLSALEAAPRRSLHYLHLGLPHVPWQFLPDGRAYRREQGMAVHGLLLNGQWAASEWEVTQAHQRHLLQLQYADRLLGELVDRLEELDLFDDSLIVVTSDHGACFRPGDRRRVLTEENLADVAHIPLMVKLPGQEEGELHEEGVETIDILPTVADVVGLTLDHEVDGRSLLEPGSEGQARKKTIYRSWLHGGAGRPWRFLVARLDATMASVERKNARFREASLYAVGRDHELLGREVAELPRSEGAGAAVIPRASDFEAVDPLARVLPVHLRGRLDLTRAVATQQRLAVALDGVVGAVTETFGALPSRRLAFTAMLDPSLLRSGGQRLEVFIVSDVDTLAPVAVTDG